MSITIQPSTPETAAFAKKLCDIAQTRRDAPKLFNEHALAREILAECFCEDTSTTLNQVFGWLNGYDAPPAGMFEPIMAAVLQDDNIHKPEFHAAISELSALLEQARASVSGQEITPLTDAQIPPEPVKPKRKTPNTNFSRQTVGPGGTGGGKTRQYYDHPSMPKRVHDWVQQPYPDLGKNRLAHIRDNTSNFYEFMEVSRLLKFGDRLPQNIQGYEEPDPKKYGALLSQYEGAHIQGGIKAILPQTKTVIDFIRAYHPNDIGMQERGINFLKQARTELACAENKKGNYRASSMMESHADSDYHIEKLQRFHLKQNKPRTVEEPEWAKDIEFRAISSKRTYLLTLRNALGKTDSELAELSNYADTTVNYALQSRHSSFKTTRQKIFDTLWEDEANRAYMNKEAFDALPDLGRESHTQAVAESRDGASRGRC